MTRLSRSKRASRTPAAVAAACRSSRTEPPIGSATRPIRCRSNASTGPCKRTFIRSPERSPERASASCNASLRSEITPESHPPERAAVSSEPPKSRPRNSSRSSCIRTAARVRAERRSNPVPSASSARATHPSESPGRKSPNGKLSQRSFAQYVSFAGSKSPDTASSPPATDSVVPAAIRPSLADAVPRRIIPRGMARRRRRAVSGSRARSGSRFCRSPAKRTEAPAFCFTVKLRAEPDALTVSISGTDMSSDA